MFNLNNILDQLGVMQWPFLFLSLLGLTIICERCWVIITDLLNEKKIHLTFSQQKTTSAENYKDKSQLDLQKRVLNWQKRLSTLSLIGTLSPLLGLFGTVWGLVLMFQNIAKTEQAITPALLADGLWPAMYSTVVGLAIAIPCIFFNGFLQSLVNRLQASSILVINAHYLIIKEQYVNVTK